MPTLNHKFEQLARISDQEQKRAMEPLRVYRPSSQQRQVHTSTAHELIIRGGKRSGKSTSGAIEFASRVLGIPVTDADGTPIPPRFPPPTPDNPQLFWVIGWDWRHIGETIHRLLLEPHMGKGGNFRVIKDKKTGEWRSYNGANPQDRARFKESKAAPQLIPERFIKPDSKKYKSAGTKEIQSLELWDCATQKVFAQICFYPSSGDNPKQGDAVSGIWIDEDIQNGEFLKEWQDRLTDKVGWLMWTVWPHSNNFALIDLLDRAEAAAGDPHRTIEAVQLLMTQNEFLPEEGKRQAIGRMGNDEEIARRDRGELPQGRMMYEFTPAIHTVETWREVEMRGTPGTFQEIVRQILKRQPRLPHDWTRYLAIDPSHTRTAVLSGVVPPPEYRGVVLGHRLVVEWEIIASQTLAADLARAIGPLVAGKNYEAFIMDQQIGRQHHAGRLESTFEVYEKAFHAEGLVSRQTRYGFASGCNIPSRRQRVVREMMIGGHGGSTLLVVESECPATIREYRTYRKKVKDNLDGSVEVLDEPANPRTHDAMAALEYLCEYVDGLFASGTAYVEPEQFSRGGSPAYFAAQAMLNKQKAALDGGYVHLGPGAAA